MGSIQQIPPISEVEFTSVRYQDEVKRNNYSTLNDIDLEYFSTILETNQICQDPAELEVHNVDCYRMVKGQGSLVLKPKTTEEVSQILKYCNDRKLAVTPQAGNTGLVAGSVPVFDEIIISTSLMNTIYEINETSGVLDCQAGCTLKNLNQYAMENGFVVPLDLAPPNCQIGGNISTNAGGLRFFRYGSLHANVLGLECVLPNGEILNLLSTVRKDNTGYDLKHLFIGSEGTLGIITRVSILCPVKPNAVGTMILGFEDFQNVLKAFREAKSHFMEIFSCCEYMDAVSMECVEENLSLKCPIGTYAHYVLIECSGNDSMNIEIKMSEFLSKMIEMGNVAAGFVGKNEEEISTIWALRKGIGAAVLYDGYTYKYDFSIPLEQFDDFIIQVRRKLGVLVKRCCGFGHLGDSNIHLAITSPTFDSKVIEILEPYVYDWVKELKGSISAEHGLGLKEKKYILHSKTPEAVKWMKNIKNLFDPNNILNPYKVLPDN